MCVWLAVRRRAVLELGGGVEVRLETHRRRRKAPLAPL